MQLTEAAISYAWAELSRRAGAPQGFAALGLQPGYGAPGSRIQIVPCAPLRWAELLTVSQLDWLFPHEYLPAGVDRSKHGPLPVLFWGQGQPRRFASPEPDGSLTIHVDLLASAIFLLCRWEEMQPGERDQHGRFTYAQSLAGRAGFLHHPLLDEYGVVVRLWLQQMLPNWQPELPQFSIRLTHDVDHLLPASLEKSLRVLAGDLKNDRDVGLFLHDFGNVLLGRSVFPQVHGIHQLMQAEKSNGLQSIFYFMAADPTQYDEGYAMELPLARRTLNWLAGQGAEIGLHPSYGSYDAPEQILQEKKRLEAVLQAPVRGGRQHYLRFGVPHTWRAWAQAGFEYDFLSLGYADAEGFRAGTCWAYPVFDLQADRTLGLVEYPLIVMDSTLKQYRNYSAKKSKWVILKLAQRCRAVNGTFTLLWHNFNLHRQWRAWGKIYLETLAVLGRLR